MANTFSGKVWRFGDDITTDLVIPNFAVQMPVAHAISIRYSGAWASPESWRVPTR
jgi:hypothetical protein